MGNKVNYKRCLELNSAYLPTKIIDSDRAYILYLKGNAEIIEEHPETFKLVNPSLEIYRPSVIRVNKYFNGKIHKVKFSRENVFKRDNYTCVYCGEDEPRAMTIDHVIPKSKGGEDSFENCVTACRPCNADKDDLTLEEWGREHPNPYRPHFLQMMKHIDYVPQDWLKYLIL